MAALHAAVPLHEESEGDNRPKQQPGREVAPNDTDCQRDAEPEDAQSRVGQPRICPAPSPFLSSAVLQPLAVLGEGRWHSPIVLHGESAKRNTQPGRAPGSQDLDTANVTVQNIYRYDS